MSQRLLLGLWLALAVVWPPGTQADTDPLAARRAADLHMITQICDTMGQDAQTWTAARQRGVPYMNGQAWLTLGIRQGLWSPVVAEDYRVMLEDIYARTATPVANQIRWQQACWQLWQRRMK